jgi:transcription elongation factor Elf1
MGMFDSIKIQCPVCRHDSVFQSKAGPCSLNKYTLYSAPLAVVADLQEDGKCGHVKCEHCEVQLGIEVQFLANVVVKHDNDWEGEE